MTHAQRIADDQVELLKLLAADRDAVFRHVNNDELVGKLTDAGGLCNHPSVCTRRYECLHA
jgi:hypothetical protein